MCVLLKRRNDNSHLRKSLTYKKNAIKIEGEIVISKKKKNKKINHS